MKPPAKGLWGMKMGLGVVVVGVSVAGVGQSLPGDRRFPAPNRAAQR